MNSDREESIITYILLKSLKSYLYDLSYERNEFKVELKAFSARISLCTERHTCVVSLVRSAREVQASALAAKVRAAREHLRDTGPKLLSLP